MEDPDADEMVFEEFFNQSRNVTLLGRPFNVEVQQLNYSFIIHVSVGGAYVFIYM